MKRYDYHHVLEAIVRNFQSNHTSSLITRFSPLGRLRGASSPPLCED